MADCHIHNLHMTQNTYTTISTTIQIYSIDTSQDTSAHPKYYKISKKPKEWQYRI